MTIPDRRLSTAEVQDLTRPLENDLTAFYRLVSDAAESLLDKAVSEGWTPEQLIDELDRMIGGDNRAAETQAVPALEDLRVNKSQEAAMPDAIPPAAQRFINESRALGVNPVEFYAGIVTESREHGVSFSEGAKIALDHLRKEDPEYYTKLQAAGL